MTLALNDHLRIPERGPHQQSRRRDGPAESSNRHVLQPGSGGDPFPRTAAANQPSWTKFTMRLLEQFDVSTAKLEADLLKLSQDMLTRGLLVKDGE